MATDGRADHESWLLLEPSVGDRDLQHCAKGMVIKARLGTSRLCAPQSKGICQLGLGRCVSLAFLRLSAMDAIMYRKDARARGWGSEDVSQRAVDGRQFVSVLSHFVLGWCQGMARSCSQKQRSGRADNVAF